MSHLTYEQLVVTGVVCSVAAMVFGFGSFSQKDVSRAVEPEVLYADEIDESFRAYVSMRDEIADGIFAGDEPYVRALLMELRDVVVQYSFGAHDTLGQRRLFIIDYLLHNRVFDVSVLGELDIVFD